MKKIISGLFGAAIFVAASLQTHAQSTLIYDQQSATGPNSPPADDFFHIQEDSPLMQSFIPALSAIGFVQFEFWDIANNGTSGATVYVNLWEGSPNINSATLLGSTAPVYMPNGFVNDGLGFAGITNFYFSTPIALTSGQTYYLQPVVLSGDDPWDIAVVDGAYYSNGRLYGSTGGYIQPITDFWFREGIPVPEPSIFALVGLSCFLVFTFKRRSKLVVPLLFTISVLSVHAAQDSVVQATADEAGLTPVAATTLSRTGTFWVMTINTDGQLIGLPYPFLPSNLSALPTYSVVNNIFIVDDTGGQLMPSSSGRISSAQASSTVQSQAESMAALIEQIQFPATNGGNQLFQPDGLMIDTNGLWLEASNEAPYLGLRAHNTISGDNYQLLSTNNLSSHGWDLGQILNASDTQMDFSPVPMTNAMTFFWAHHANPVMEIYNSQYAIEPNPTNSDPGQVGAISIYNEGWATNDVAVYYTIGGTAQNGIDYSNLTGVAIVPLNQGYAEIDIDPIADGLKPDQTVILTLLQNTNYLIDPANDSATNILQANPEVVPTAFGDDEPPMCPNSTNNITLRAEDPNNLPLTFSILTYPTHGTLTYATDENYGSEVTNVIYTPTNCYEGQDSFTFKANNGQFDSAPATVTLTISDSVYAYPVSTLVFRSDPAGFTLSGGDNCSETLGYAPLFQPAHGTVTNVSGSSTDPNYVYVPAVTNFIGTDSFDYVAFNDCGDAATNTVTFQFVDGPILFHDCNPFGAAVKLDWMLDANDQQENLNINDFIIYRSTNSGSNYTAIATNYYSTSDDWMSYLDTNSVVGQTNYYAVTFQAYDTSGILHESPFSNEIGAAAQNPSPLIPPDAVWQVVTNLGDPSSVTNLQAPFSSYGTNQYPGLYPLPNTLWPIGTTWSNHITMFIPTNSVPLAQVTYSIAIDNNYQLYLNNSNAPVEIFNHDNDATWSPFKAFEDVAPGLLHYGTNDIRVVIQDTGGIDYFSMIVETNTCGQ